MNMRSPEVEIQQHDSCLETGLQGRCRSAMARTFACRPGCPGMVDTLWRIPTINTGFQTDAASIGYQENMLGSEGSGCDINNVTDRVNIGL